MGGPFHYYFDAAQALWEMPSQELYSLARGNEPEAVQRAAELTLRLKAEYVTPEAYRDERTTLTKLASELSNDPEFGLDLALGIARRGAGPKVPQDIRWVTRPSRKSIALWVTVVAAVTLLVLDVLATAGVPVPTPIGDLLDRISGEDFAPRTPAPPPSPTGAGIDLDTRQVATAPNGSLIQNRAATHAGNETEKNVRHADGRDDNHQNGKERYFQNGKERNHQKGRPHASRVKVAHGNERSTRLRDRARDLAERAKQRRRKR